MQDVRSDYAQLYVDLRTFGLNVLLDYIEDEGISEYARDAMEMIFRMPHPLYASGPEVRDIANQLNTRFVELATVAGDARQLSERLVAQIEEGEFPEGPLFPGPPELEPTFPSSVATLQFLQYARMLDLSADLRSLSAARDINLKGQCYSCGGPLVEVLVVIEDVTDERELRLRCKRQENQDCKDYDWLIGRLKRRNH